MRKANIIEPIQNGIIPQDLKNSPGFLHIDNLSKSYLEGDQRRMVFQNVAISVERGEIVAILGKSGTGKTTLLNLVSGIDRVDEGQIFLEEKSLTGLDERRLTLFRRQNIGFIFQFFNLIPTLTVWENLCLPLELNGLNRAEDFQRAQDPIGVIGMNSAGGFRITIRQAPV